MEQRFYDALQDCPIIAAVRDEAGLDACLASDVRMVFTLFGDAQAVRTTHHVTMYFFIIFTFAHLYMSFREDVMGGATTISSMTTGLRMFKETHH